MKVRDHIELITDLLLGAMYADKRFDDSEKHALRKLLCELICRHELPANVEDRIRRFTPEQFDVAAAASQFRADAPMSPKRLLELAAQLCTADGEIDLEEDEYIRSLGRALELDPTEYEDVVLDYEVQDLTWP